MHVHGGYGYGAAPKDDELTHTRPHGPDTHVCAIMFELERIKRGEAGRHASYSIPLLASPIIWRTPAVDHCLPPPHGQIAARQPACISGAMWSTLQSRPHSFGQVATKKHDMEVRRLVRPMPRILAVAPTIPVRRRAQSTRCGHPGRGGGGK